MPVYCDDLPSISVSRLRATGVIAADTTEFLVRLGHVEKTVSIHLRKFPNGGSWSWFGCPTCGKSARTLRLHGDDIVCPGCCKRLGIRHRCEMVGLRRRAQLSIPRLRAKLGSPVSLRLKPHLWGTMERRARLEARLKRAEYFVWRRLARQNPYGK